MQLHDHAGEVWMKACIDSNRIKKSSEEPGIHTFKDVQTNKKRKTVKKKARKI